ncbi:MAG: ABC transporter ATP-binding protein [Nocardioides sp.]|nr:ABC transporter ATP-binding protein [Nocardioides sp.]
MRDRLGAYLSAASDAVGRRRLVLLFFVQLGAALTEAGTLVLLLPVVQLLVGAESVTLPLVDRSVPPGAAVALLASFVVARALIQWVAAVVATDLRLRTMDHLRIGALRELFAASWPFISAQRRSHLVQGLTTEVMRSGAAIDLLIRSAVALLILIATAGAMIVISPLAGGLALAAVAVLALIAYPTLASATRLGQSHSERIAAFGALITDSLQSIRLIRAHDAADRWTGLIEREARHGREVQLRYVRTTAGVRAGLGLLAVGTALALVLLGRELGLGAAELVVLAVIATRLLSSLQALVTQAQTFNHLAPAIDKVRDLAASAAAHPDTAAPTPAAPAPRAGSHPPLVELRHVAVGYGDVPVLDDLSLSIAPGGLTVITGPSGVGKSTLLDVLLGLLPPAEGDVLVDGAPLRDLPAWRARLGYVPQDTVLIPGSVWDNLTWSSRAPVTLEAAWAALETAHLADVVRSLPDGLDTDLHDLTRLSGGEQQRLCLARALVRDPELLVLDEATNALDERTEAAVLTRLRALPMALVLVTHRPVGLDGAEVVALAPRDLGDGHEVVHDLATDDDRA